MAPEQPGAFEERVLRRLPFEIVVLTAVLAAAAAFVLDPLTALAFLAGGVFAAAGFVWLRRALARLLSREKKGALRAGIALYALRLVLICAVFFLIILLYPKKIIAFVAGLSTVVLVSLFEGVRGLLLLGSWKD